MTDKPPLPADLRPGRPERLTANEIRDVMDQLRTQPHAASLLGFKAVDFSIEDAWIEAEFDPDPRTANMRGGVQGGMICAMLDEVMSFAVVIGEGFTVGVPTLEMKTSFLAPLPLGVCRGHGQAVRIGRNIAFMEGTIWTPDGQIAAKATSTCQVRRPT